MARITVIIILNVFIMSDIVKHTIDVTPIGLEKLSQVPAIISKVGDSVANVKTPLDPLNKIVQILSRIEKILMAIGRVGVESFNKLDDILVTNRDHFKKATDKATELEAKIEKIGDTSKKAGKDVKEGFLDNFNKIGVAVQSARNVASVAAGIFTPIFEEGMARQNAVSDFETLLYGDRGAAEKLAKDIRATDAAKLYGTTAINENIKLMLGYGVDTETSFQVTEALGDIAMGSKDKMNSLAMAFSQMSGLGVLQTQDWKQMVGAGFNPFNQMEKELGKSKDELNTMMSKGLITSDMVKNAFIHATQLSYKDKEGKTQYTYNEVEAKANSADGSYEKGQFYGSTEGSLKNTLSGRIVNIKSSFDEIKNEIFEQSLPIVEIILPLITDKILPVITDQVLPAITSVAEFLTPVFDLIADNIDTVGVFIGVLGTLAAVCSVVNAVMSANPIALIVIGIAALIALIYKVIDAYDRWGAALTFILGPLGLIINVIMTIKRYWDDIVSAFQNDGIIAGLKRIGVCILDMVLYPVQQLLGWVAELTGWDWAKKAQEYVNGFRDSINAINPEDAKKAPDVVDTPNDNGTQHTLENAVTSNTYTKNGGGDLSNATKQGAEAVASGGTRNTQITINLGNMVETVNFNGTPADNAQETVDTFTSQLLRVLYSAQTAV